MQANFFNDLNRGKVGERIFIEIMAERGWEIEDLSNDKTYQKKGVDFCVKKGNQRLMIDVKTDYVMYKTGNIFLELKDGPRVGWAKKTEADLIFYIDYNANRAYVLDWASCAAKIDDLRKVAFNNQDGISMVGALLPTRELDKLQIKYQILEF